MKQIISLIVATILSISVPVFGVIEYKDGGTHNINSATNDDVSVDYQAPGMHTTVNVLDGGGITTPPPHQLNYWGILEAYNDSTINVFGGYVDTLNAYDSTVVNIAGYHISKLNAWNSTSVNILPYGTVNGDVVVRDNSRVVISGGLLDNNLIALNTSNITITGGSVHYSLIACGSSTVAISGGSVSTLRGVETSRANIFGGRISQLNALGNSTTTFYGYDFTHEYTLSFEGNKILGTGWFSGKWFDGTQWTTQISEHNTGATILALSPLLLHNPNGSESISAGTIYTISWSSMGSISNVLNLTDFFS